MSDQHQQRIPRRRGHLNGLIAAAVVTLLTLGGFTLWQNFDTQQSGARITLADVTEMRIERADHPTLVLRGSDHGDTWRIVEPWTLPANQQRIEPLLAALVMGGRGYAPAEVEFAATGLAEPAATLVIDTTRIDIGAPDASGSRRYARRDGRILLIDTWLYSLIDGGVSAIARLQPFDATLTQVQAARFRPLPVADWQQISARQIVAWPIVGRAPLISRSTLIATLDSPADGTQTRRYDVVHTTGYTALHPADTGYAYVFANEDWPCPNSPKSKLPAEALSRGC